VLIERIAGEGYRASGAAPVPIVAEAATREAALAKLREQIQARLRDGAEIVPLEVGAQAHPLAEFAGMFKEDPYFDDVLKMMAANRRKLDQHPKAPRARSSWTPTC
jgi:hypothetical protein